MNEFGSRKADGAAGGYSLNPGKLRTWLLVVALLFGIFASSPTSQTTAFAKSDTSRTLTSKDNSGATSSGVLTPSVTYNKTGPASVNSGSATNYKFTITNSDPISYFGYILDIYPPELTYTDPFYVTDGTSYACFDTGSIVTATVSIPGLVRQSVTGDGGVLLCEVLLVPNLTVTINTPFLVTGSGGDCFTNISEFQFIPFEGNIPNPDFKSKADAEKNVQAITNSSLQVTIADSDFTTCLNRDEAKPPADLEAQLRVTPDRTDFIDPSGDISYTLTAKNIGVGSANKVQVTFPFDTNLDVGYLSSLDPNVWVSSVDTTSEQHSVTINMPNIQPGEVYSATLVMRPSATAATGSVEFNRFTVKWDDAERAGKTAGSNAVRYSFSAESGSTLNLTGGEVQLFDPAEATVKNGQEQILKGDFFAPGENVTAWYTAPDGTSTALGSANAGPNGEISISLTPANLTAGDKYNVSAYGNRSGVYGSSVVTIGS